MERTLTNNYGLKRSANGYPNGNGRALLYNEKLAQENIVVSLKAKFLAAGIFLFYFIENGTLGILPEKMYYVYRNMRISDLILYGLILYSLINLKEYRDLFKSRSFLIVKILLFYFVLEFAISFVRYGFNPIEYFFRLKGLWSSFLVFPFLLLIKRNGLKFLIKLILPFAIVSNILYLITAITKIPFSPDVSVVRQLLPGGIEVFRVYGGTFFGELYFLGFIYFWIYKKFKFYQIFLVGLFVFPHLLAFGRSAWAYFLFTIFCFVLINSLQKRNFKVLFRQAFILIILISALVYGFIKFIPESDYYVDALYARVFQGQEDVKYNEGTYGGRILFQNNALLRLWMNSDVLLGVGMHPMWVYRPESYEEQVYYNAFSDVGWPAILAAYGAIGFSIAAFFQVFFIFITFRLVKRTKKVDIFSFLLIIAFSKLIFDSCINFSYALFSVSLWGLWGSLNYLVPVIVSLYEENKKEGMLEKNLLNPNGQNNKE